jgi:hypothetical protein
MRYRYLLAWLAVPMPAAAAPCAGFNDVQATDSFCSAVEWIRNRSITLGCGPSAYCPNDGVPRWQMALFLNRLGTKLTPEVAFVEASFPALDLDAPPSLCTTAAIAATAYPRRALVSIAFGGLSGGDLSFSARPLVSTDGVNWSPLTTQSIRESVVGSAWTNTATLGVYSIPATQKVHFALGLARESGAANFAQVRCQLIASVVNANGTSPPF